MANPTPDITFRVNLTPNYLDYTGPSNNRTQLNVSVDNYQSDQDTAASEYAARTSNRSAYLASLQVRPNVKLKHGDEFTEYGQKAVYLRNLYGIGYATPDRAFLEII